MHAGDKLLVRVMHGSWIIQFVIIAVSQNCGWRGRDHYEGDVTWVWCMYDDPYMYKRHLLL